MPEAACIRVTNRRDDGTVLRAVVEWEEQVFEVIRWRQTEPPCRCSGCLRVPGILYRPIGQISAPPAAIVKARVLLCEACVGDEPDAEALG